MAWLSHLRIFWLKVREPFTEACLRNRQEAVQPDLSRLSATDLDLYAGQWLTGHSRSRKSSEYPFLSDRALRSRREMEIYDKGDGRLVVDLARKTHAALER